MEANSSSPLVDNLLSLFYGSPSKPPSKTPVVSPYNDKSAQYGSKDNLSSQPVLSPYRSPRSPSSPQMSSSRSPYRPPPLPERPVSPYRQAPPPLPERPVSPYPSRHFEYDQMRPDSDFLREKLEKALSNLKADKVVNISGLKNMGKFRVDRRPLTNKSMYVVFMNGKLMATNPADVKYAGELLGRDNLMQDFLAEQERKMSSRALDVSAKKMRDQNHVMNGDSKIKVAINVDRFSETGKTRRTALPLDKDRSRWVYFYNDRLAALIENEADVEAYAEYISEGDDAVKNGILASFYEAAAAKEFGVGSKQSRRTAAQVSSPRALRSMTRARAHAAEEDAPACSRASPYARRSMTRAQVVQPSTSRPSSPYAVRSRSRVLQEDDGVVSRRASPYALRTKQRVEPESESESDYESDYDDESDYESPSPRKYKSSSKSYF